MNHLEITSNERGINLQVKAEIFASPSVTLDMTARDFETSIEVIEGEPAFLRVTRGGVTLLITMETAAEIGWASYIANLGESA